MTRFDIVAAPGPGVVPDAVRDLLPEYGESLAFNTCFGGFDQELVASPGHYEPPRGCLLLEKEGGCGGALE